MRPLTEREDSFTRKILIERPPRWFMETTYVNYIKEGRSERLTYESNPRVRDMVMETYTIEFTAYKGKAGLYWVATREL